MDMMSVEEAAGMLGVSASTIRNWVRHGYLASGQKEKNRFPIEKVRELRRKIRCGAIDRLRTRANKHESGRVFVPEEFTDSISFIKQIREIQSVYAEQELCPETAMFVLVLKLLVLSEEVKHTGGADVLCLSSCTGWKRECVKKEMYEWEKGLPDCGRSSPGGYRILFSLLSDAACEDAAGIVYQSIQSEGSRSQRGVYNTPPHIVDDIFSEYACPGKPYLDPCCGTGQFLLGAVRAGYSDPSMLYGYELDSISARIARINLMLAFAGKEFKPRILQENALKAQGSSAAAGFHCRFGLVATNPPWGAAVSRGGENDCSSLHPHISSGESFSLFLSKSIKMADDNGIVSSILPESILNIKVHSDIRDYILKHTRIKRVTCLGRAFPTVLSPVIRLDLKKGTGSGSGMVKVVPKNGSEYRVDQQRFRENSGFLFDVFTRTEEKRIIDFVYDRPHATLKDNADWAVGIVTGNNRKYVSTIRENGMEPVYRGRDIEKYRLKPPGSFISFKPELFQQTAPEETYRAPEKLVYRFISDRLVFACDSSGSLTLNSANIIIPRLQGYPVRLVLAFLNSSLFQFVFSKCFRTRRILRGDLERLPFPVLSDEQINGIILLADRAAGRKDIQEKIDLEIMHLFDMPEHDIRFIAEKYKNHLNNR